MGRQSARPNPFRVSESEPPYTEEAPEAQPALYPPFAPIDNLAVMFFLVPPQIRPPPATDCQVHQQRSPTCPRGVDRKFGVTAQSVQSIH